MGDLELYIDGPGAALLSLPMFRRDGVGEVSRLDVLYRLKYGTFGVSTRNVATNVMGEYCEKGTTDNDIAEQAVARASSLVFAPFMAGHIWVLAQFLFVDSLTRPRHKRSSGMGLKTPYRKIDHPCIFTPWNFNFNIVVS